MTCPLTVFRDGREVGRASVAYRDSMLLFPFKALRLVDEQRALPGRHAMIPFHGSQYPGQAGHYESWFVRANDPRRARAFWIRYTRFMAADGRPSMGELWAIAFDGDRPPWR